MCLERRNEGREEEASIDFRRGKKGPAQEIPGKRRRGQHRFQEKEKGASTDFRNSFLMLC